MFVLKISKTNLLFKNIEAHLKEVSEKSEDFYTDSFFESINCVVTALDSVTARLFTFYFKL